jgi:hypothetical protein
MLFIYTGGFAQAKETRQFDASWRTGSNTPGGLVSTGGFAVRNAKKPSDK